MKYLDCGFEYILSLIDPVTPMGREELRAMTFLKRDKDIEAYHKRQLEVNENESKIESLKSILERIRDIRGTISNLSSGKILDDIELFEIKSFAYWSERLRSVLGVCSFWMQLPDLSIVFSFLDPDNAGTESFYISDRLDNALAVVRKELHRLQRNREKHGEESLDELIRQNLEIEDRVRADLSGKLAPYRENLQRSATTIGKIDLIVALVELNRELGLRKPEISSGEYEFEELVNPELAASLSKSGKSFQPFSARFERKSVIIGGNMTGKSVLLRTVALLQTMFQHGLFVPAKRASIPVYDAIVYYSGDKQSFLDGLSSFAGEVDHLKKALEIVHKDIGGLFLFDEIGRSTNPVEGPAFLMASAEYLSRNEKCRTILTSHYEEALEIEGAQLFIIKGLDHERIRNEIGREISYYVDHSLVEIESNAFFPREAVTIARLLGLEREFIELIVRNLKESCE
ncbi:MAG: permease [Kosmotogaceae bacterium]|nr:permease [Kosmotogaceae bacterium]